MELTGPQLPLLRRATSSVPGAHTGVAHLCLCSRTGFSLHCPSEKQLRSAPRQRKAPWLRPDSGAYWLVAADIPSERFLASPSLSRGAGHLTDTSAQLFA
ncbi:hypothetical protein NDU88_009489 [Pleurodeles waltl]|uniref:Uncharacterized protein n=1 Tax=Pleurodeles waltl TaxID=8319 RepID=A0AAV7RYJ7_PLEWA|nr:hypothetical protein NDU88_009489 [Pleurodeles waltl]